MNEIKRKINIFIRKLICKIIGHKFLDIYVMYVCTRCDYQKLNKNFISQTISNMMTVYLGNALSKNFRVKKNPQRDKDVVNSLLNTINNEFN